MDALYEVTCFCWLSSSLCWSGWYDLEWGLSSSCCFCDGGRSAIQHTADVFFTTSQKSGEWQGWLKMTDQTARHEHTGRENTGHVISVLQRALLLRM